MFNKHAKRNSALYLFFNRLRLGTISSRSGWDDSLLFCKLLFIQYSLAKLYLVDLFTIYVTVSLELSVRISLKFFQLDG